MTSNGDLITAVQAARIANTTEATIRTWQRNGWLPVAQEMATQPIGRPRKLYSRAAVERLARERGRIE